MKHLTQKISVIFLTILRLITAELYTSVHELSRGAQVEVNLLNLLEFSIRHKQEELTRLHNVLQKFKSFEKTNIAPELSVDDRMLHPVKAFVAMRKLVEVLDELEVSLEEENSLKFSIDQELKKINENFTLPTNDDLVGTGEALLRLQNFYDLDIENIIRGNLSTNLSTSISQIDSKQYLDFEDCFEIARIAYDDGQYSLSIKWFQKTLELRGYSLDTLNSSQSDEIFVNEILEYMAFSAYKLGKLDQSAQLTRIWLKRDPQNDRAKENLEYYEEELKSSSESSSAIDEEVKISYDEMYKTGERFNPNNYQVIGDDLVRSLCRESSQKQESSSKNRCFTSPTNDKTFLRHSKVEQINSDPRILRIYDIISEEEAKHLLKLASTRLLRSTVQSGAGLVTTDFRIAKTAWLSSDQDPIVAKIDERLGSILQLNLNNSENLQVVNYGLGGFYGPHLDSARESMADLSDDGEDSVPLLSLKRNDRMATILIYLNHVEAGGATVFPRINLKVEPIERSAVVWFNLKRNGFTDEKTLHTGCPILIGSKWIATKWPRERENTFLRPCGLSKSI